MWPKVPKLEWNPYCCYCCTDILKDIYSKLYALIFNFKSKLSWYFRSNDCMSPDYCISIYVFPPIYCQPCSFPKYRVLYQRQVKCLLVQIRYIQSNFHLPGFSGGLGKAKMPGKQRGTLNRENIYFNFHLKPVFSGTEIGPVNQGTGI